MLPKSPPYRLNKHANRYFRKILCNPPQWNPSVVLKTTVDAQELLTLTKQKGVSLNSCLVKALAMALVKYPRLNYLAFWGDLVWAGDHTKVAVVREEKPLEEVSEFVIEDAEAKLLEQIQQEIKREKCQETNDHPVLLKLMDRFPRLFFLLGKYTGILTKSLASSTGPIVLSNINVPGIDEMITAGVAYAIIVNPGRLKEGKLPLNLAFNHQLANARAVAAYLAEVKELLEQPQRLVNNLAVDTVSQA